MTPAPSTDRRLCRRAIPAALTGVIERHTRDCALSIDSGMPPCSDQPKDNNAAHVKAEAARAVFRACFMGSLRCAKNINVARVPTSPGQIEFRLFGGNVDNVHVTAMLGVGLRSPRPH